MTTLTTASSGSNGLNMGLWSAGALLNIVNQPTDIGYSSTLMIFQNGSTFLYAWGTFSNFVDGIPQSGTVTEMYYVSPSAGAGSDLVDIAFENISLSVASVNSWAATNNATALQNALFGGDDTLTGSNANEALYGYNGNDTIYGAFGNDTLQGMAGGDSLYGGDGEDYIVGGDGSDVLYGDEGNDTLQGDAGIDLLFAGGGNDRLYGAAGDLIDGGDGSDQVFLSTSNQSLNPALWSSSTGQTLSDGTLIRNVESFTISGASLTLAPTFSSAPGYSPLNYVEFGTTLTLDFSAVTLSVTIIQSHSSQNNILINGDLWLGARATGYPSAAYNITGSAGDDTLLGGTGNDVLNGGAGNDALNGAGGVDTASYAGATSAVAISLALMTQQNTQGAGLDTLSGFENLLGSNYNDTLTGDGAANRLEGGLGADVLEGGAGNDVLDGGSDQDTASYASATSAVAVSLALATAQNTIGAGLDTLANIENLRGSDYNDTLTGNAASNVLEGGAGNDALNGAGGIDTASYASAASAVTVSLALTTQQNTLGAGLDTITNIENLLGSAFNDTLTGNGSANTLNGGGGADTLDGGAGNDDLNGGDDVDTASYASAASAVTVSLALATAQNTGGGGTDTLTSIENLAGSNYNDTLTGNALANSLTGGSGADTLTGGLGSDALTGGSGADTFVCATSAESAIAAFDTITDFTANLDRIDIAAADAGRVALQFIGGAVNVYFGGASGDYTAMVYAIGDMRASDVITSSTAIDIFGSGLSETLISGNGNDFISGGGGGDYLVGQVGADRMLGGAGADIFFYGAASDSTNLVADTIYDFEGGVDLLHLYYSDGGQIAMVYQPDHVEVYFGDDGLGNYTGRVAVSGDIRAADILTASPSIDVFGSGGNETLISGNGADFISGAGGDDFIVGQVGADRIFGGSGADTFFYGAASDTALGATDTIYDFESGLDHLHLYFADAGQVALNHLGDHTQVYFGDLGDGNFAGRIDVYGNPVLAADIITSDADILVFA